MRQLFEANLNNLTKEERESFLELIERSKKVPEISEKRCRSKIDDEYYYIASDGEIILEPENGAKFDELNFQFGNYFKTENEAIFEKNKRQVYQQLFDYALEHNEEKIKWDNRCQQKFYIVFNTHKWNVDVEFTYESKSIGQIYFTSREIARDAIKEIGEDKIKYYLFGID